MAEQISSFSNLKVDEKLRQSKLAGYFSNPRLLILFILLLVIVGVFSFINIPRVLNPSINIAIVNVSTVLPGAGPEDVESLVTVPIEDAVSGLENVKTVTSTSSESVSVVSIEFNTGVDAKKARTDTQGAVDTVSLPDDAQDPRVQDLDFQNEPVWSFTVTSKEDKASLSRFVTELKTKIDDIPEVKEVVTSGLEEQEVQIVLKPEVIADLGINTQVLIGAIKTAVSSFPAGNVRTETSNFALTLDPSVATTEDIRDLKLNLNGVVVSLGEVAEVVERSKPEQTHTSFISPNESLQPGVDFNIYKTSTAQIEKTAQKVETLVDEILEENQHKFEIHSVQNSAEFISDQFNELLRDFWITVSLVFLTLLVFLGLRQALISSVSIPLTFFFTFTVMRLTNIEFSFIAFFSLLLSLGLLVDDTIVVISAITAYYRTRRFTPLEAGLLVWKDFLVPIFTTTLTTVWAFVPLLLASGIIGEFIKPIPIVVSTTLLASFVVAMFITLPLSIIILKPYFAPRVRVFLRVFFIIAIIALFIVMVPKTNLLLLQILAFLIFLVVFINIREYLFSRINQVFSKRIDTKKTNSRIKNFADEGLISFEPMIKHYYSFINRILYSSSGIRKTTLAVVIFFIFSVILFPLGYVKNEFFPGSDEDYLYVSLELPPGTNLETTEKQANAVLLNIKDTPGMAFATQTLGRGIGNFGFGGSGANTALISIRLQNKGVRNKTSLEIAQLLREKFQNYSKGKVVIQEVSGGPPAGADLQIKLYGPDLKKLDEYAANLMDFLSKQSGVADVDKSIKAGTSKITFVPDQTKLAANDLTLDQVGFSLRTYASGIEADSIKFSGETEKKDITIRLSSASQLVESLGKVQIQTQSGAIALISLGKLKLEPNPSLITREDGKRTLSVSASVLEGFNVTEKNKQLEDAAKNLKLPSGYGWQTGGVNEENQNSVNSILQAMILSFLLIIVTMVIQFSSFRDALIVMLVIPLAVSGVFIIFALTRTPLSFPALIGVLALFGIVVKNSILLVDKINQNKKAGMPLREAISDASATRIEPIFLTSFATIVGLLPITFSNPLWRGLGGAIIAGLVFSGTIMLLFIPVMYYLFFRGSEEVKATRSIRKS